MKRLGGLRGFVAAVVAVALVAPSLGTAWTSRTQSVASGDRRNGKVTFEGGTGNDGGDNDQQGVPAALTALRAPFAWGRTTGEGVTVAIMDSGVADHPDLADKVKARLNFVNDGST